MQKYLVVGDPLKRVKGVTERLFTYIMIYKGVGAKGMKDVA